METAISFGPSNSGCQIGVNNGILNVNPALTTEETDRLYIRALRFPDSQLVRNQLKQEKDQIRPVLIEWLLQDPQYKSWQDGNEVCLLWIKGGAGKGKTMMTIGIIDKLICQSNEASLVTYFFCRNADCELNTLAAIIKGLIFQLINKDNSLKECLRNHWNKMQLSAEYFMSWQNLWHIFLEMLAQSRSSRVYIIVDALDECQDDGMCNFLQAVVRNGLDYPQKMKWLFTSRPLDSAERELLGGHDQAQVSLELNCDNVSESVRTYIIEKVRELDRRAKYGETLRQKLENELTERAEGTFLWVSLACKKLENIPRHEAISMIQDLPPGLTSLYRRVFKQLQEGHPTDVKACMRLLNVMSLIYRPLRLEEVASVSGPILEEANLNTLVDRCASFLKRRENNIEFIHQSARDFLKGEIGQALLDLHEPFGHNELVLSCLNYLDQCLKVNLMHLPQPYSPKWSLTSLENENSRTVLKSFDYAATFWAQHLSDAESASSVRSVPARDKAVYPFIQKRFLEWVECLSLLERLPSAVGALQTLEILGKDNHPLLGFVQDAKRFLLRHYHTLANWPLQAYSSALIFSPQSSVVRKENSNKIPKWLKRAPHMEKDWTFLIQTLAGHSDWVSTVAYSPNGKQIASGSSDKSVKLWDAATGDYQKTLVGHSKGVTSVAFSPDGKQIASGSSDKTVKLWDAATGDDLKTLAGHSKGVTSVAFSPDGKQIASGSSDKTVKLWDAATGDHQKTFIAYSDWVTAVAYSPDGRQIASGSGDSTIELWDAVTGEHQKTLIGHSDWISAVVFSLDGKQIASSSYDKTIMLWDAWTGDHKKTLIGHSDRLSAVAFSPDSKQIASSSYDFTIKLWDAITGDYQKTLLGHSGWVGALAFSPDSKHIISSSYDIKLWDAGIADHQKTLIGHSKRVTFVAFSPDGKQIASGSSDNTIKLWDIATGDHLKTLAGHSEEVSTVVFSPDSKLIVSGSSDKTVKLWDAATGDHQKTLIGHLDLVTAMAFSPDGRQIASCSRDYTTKLWDSATGDHQKTLASHSNWVTAVAFSPDGRQIVFGTNHSIIELWDAVKGDYRKSLLGHSDWVSVVVFSPDGKQILSSSHDKTIKLWNATTGDLQCILTGHSDWVAAVSFSLDGKEILSCSFDKTVKLWNTATGGHQTLLGHSGSGLATAVAFSLDGTQIASGSPGNTIKVENTMISVNQEIIAGHPYLVRAVAFSPDGTQFASGSRDDTIMIWDTATSELIKTLRGQFDWVSAIAFSPDGKQIASGSSDKTIRLWDVVTGDYQKTLIGHLDWVTAVAFSPDGKHIASGSSDKTIKLWDASTGDYQKTLVGHSKGVISLAFSPDSKQIASGLSDRTIRVWPLEFPLKASKYVKHNLGNRSTFRLYREIETSESASTIKFSADKQYLITNMGLIKLKGTQVGLENYTGSLQDIYVQNQWIYHGKAPLFRLTSDLVPSCYDVQGGQVAIGLENGRVLSFEVDRQNL